tara:strand:+ start:554 stop:760 length:207 start_codon:yes stop_codon:yes gene_type:complete
MVGQLVQKNSHSGKPYVVGLVVESHRVDNNESSYSHVVRVQFTDKSEGVYIIRHNHDKTEKGIFVLAS